MNPSMDSPAESSRKELLRLLVRVAVFVLLVIAGNIIFPMMIATLAGSAARSGDSLFLLVTSALSTFAAGAFANAFVARGWEQGKLSDFGMGWTSKSLRKLLTGVGAAVAATLLIVLIAV